MQEEQENIESDIQDEEVISDENASKEKSKVTKDTPSPEQIIDDLNNQVSSMQEKLLRSMAETENTRIRSNKMVEEARTYSIAEFAKDLIPAMDNLSRALDHLPEDMNEETKNVVEGVKMTKNELATVFQKYKLDMIEPKSGDQFDYNHHHAVSQIATDDYPEGIVVDVVQAGYKIKDRLLRPATVVVAKKK